MKKIITHTTSRFHTDDVFAVAILDLFYKEDIEVIRTSDTEVIKSADIVVDIGGIYDEKTFRFDHHQDGGAGQRENGIQYASAGLVWKHFGEKLSGSRESAEIVDKRLIQSIDANDNGQSIYDLKYDFGPYVLQNIISLYINRDGDEKEDLQAFLEAVEFAKFILNKEIENTKTFVDSKNETLALYEAAKDKRVIVFDNEKFSSDTRANVLSEFEEPLFLIYPDMGRNTWRAKGVRKGDGFEIRLPLPKDWGGKFDETLQETSGVSDATFCHRGLFTCAAKTKEGVLKMVDLTMNKG